MVLASPGLVGLLAFGADDAEGSVGAILMVGFAVVATGSVVAWAFSRKR